MKVLFYTITNLQGSQTKVKNQNTVYSFTPLQTYKVLKRNNERHKLITVLHHYKLTRFSNPPELFHSFYTVLHHYKLTRFSNRDS